MKVVVLHGSPRKGNTDAVVNRVKAFMMQQVQVDFIDFYLPKDAPVFCHGCFTCFEQGEDACPNAQYIQPIARAIEDADGLIIAAPIYVMQIPGAVKAFLDHMAYRYLNHRPRYFKLKAMIITTTAGAGNPNAHRYLKQNLSFWGIRKIIKLGIAFQAASFDDMAAKRRQKAEALIERRARQWVDLLKDEKTDKRTSFLSVIMFHISRSLMHMMPEGHADRSYWEQQGWMNPETKFYLADTSPAWYKSLAGKAAARFTFK